MSALRRSLAALALAGSTAMSPAAAQVVEWAQRAGGSGAEEGGDFDHGSAVTTDSRGNIYATGGFSGRSRFGFGDHAQTLEQVTASDGHDIFVAKYAPDRTLLWARSAGGYKFNSGNGISTDSRGNLYVAGTYREDAMFGEGEPTETRLYAELYNAFVASYTKDGALQWARFAGGNSTVAYGGDIVADGSGNSYMVGSFDGPTATLGEGEANETVLQGAGEREVFVAKFSPEGALQWAVQLGGGGDDYPWDIARDGKGRLIVVGSYTGTASFGSYMLEATDGRDVFVAKFSASGDVLWAKSLDGDGGGGVVTDKNNNIYVTGTFIGAAEFGVGDPRGTTLTSWSTGRDIFVAKLNDDGEVQWARGLGGSGNDTGYDLAVDPSNNVFVTGADDNSTFLAKYTSKGERLARLRSPGKGNGVAADRQGNAIVIGDFTGTTWFGTKTFIARGVKGPDIFLVKYRPTASTALVASAP